MGDKEVSTEKQFLQQFEGMLAISAGVFVRGVLEHQRSKIAAVFVRVAALPEIKAFLSTAEVDSATASTLQEIVDEIKKHSEV